MRRDIILAYVFIIFLFALKTRLLED